MAVLSTKMRTGYFDRVQPSDANYGQVGKSSLRSRRSNIYPKLLFREQKETITLRRTVQSYVIVQYSDMEEVYFGVHK